MTVKTTRRYSGSKENPEFSTHKEALSDSRTERSDCDGKLKYVLFGFYSDIDWHIYECQDCGALVETAGSKIFEGNASVTRERLRFLANLSDTPVDWADLDTILGDRHD